MIKLETKEAIPRKYIGTKNRTEVYLFFDWVISYFQTLKIQKLVELKKKTKKNKTFS